MRATLAVLFLLATTGWSQSSRQTPGGQTELLKRVAFEQKLNSQLPTGLTFRDETGRTVALKEYFGKKPVVLLPVYYECPMLCNLSMSELVKTLKTLQIEPGKVGIVTCKLGDPLPNGEFLVEEFYRAGGMPALMQALADRLHLDAATVAGRQVRETIADHWTTNPRVIGTLERPIKPRNALRVLRGNLAPGGALIKESAATPRLLKHTGRSTLVELSEAGTAMAESAAGMAAPMMDAAPAVDADGNPIAQAPPAAAAAPTQGHGQPHRGPRELDAATQAAIADGVELVRGLLADPPQPPRWPMYLRQIKQFIRASHPDFDDRKYGSIVDLMRACQKEGLVKLERDRQGGLRVFGAGGSAALQQNAPAAPMPAGKG